MVTEEFKAEQFPSDEVGVRDLKRVSLYDEAAWTRRSATISKIQADRLRPREVRSRDLVPAHIRERYTDLWAQEDREHIKRAAWEASFRGRCRLWLKKAVGI